MLNPFQTTPSKVSKLVMIFCRCYCVCHPGALLIGINHIYNEDKEKIDFIQKLDFENQSKDNIMSVFYKVTPGSLGGRCGNLQRLVGVYNDRTHYRYGHRLNFQP